MRPYLAIIKDSFRSALASRVLYVLLGLITLVLLVLAPAHIRESLDTKIRSNDVRDPFSLLSRINEDRVADNQPGVQRIWNLLSDDLKQEITKLEDDNQNSEANKGDDDASESESESAADSESKTVTVRVGGRNGRRGPGRRGRPRQGSSDLQKVGISNRLIEELNELIKDEDFFRTEDWTDRNYGSEATGLLEIERSQLTEAQAQRLNRILISESFGSLIRSGSPTSINAWYGWYNAEWLPLGGTHQQFASQITNWLPFFFDKIVLSLGLLIAILVTANIIPQTFEAGTLNLLLSKPVSRSGLFLAKFVGGCVFIAICATLLFVGMWLWMGLGLRIWDRSVLISIPLYVLVFAIYYSVASFVGLTTRSTILSIIVTGVFWAMCFGVGGTYSFFNARMENAEIHRVVKGTDAILQVNPASRLRIWDGDENVWTEPAMPDVDDEEKMARGIIEAFGGADGMPPVLGPIEDPVRNQTVVGRILVTDQSTFNQQQFLVSEDGKKFELKGTFPRETVRLFATKEGILAATRRGKFYRYRPETKIKTETSTEEVKTDAKERELFVAIGPEAAKEIRNENLIDVNRLNSEVAIYSRGELQVFKLLEEGEEGTSERYVFDRSVEVETGTRASMSCRIAYQGNTILVVLGNGQIISLDAETLQEKNGYLPETRFAAETVTASADGRWFAVCYRNETLWLLDTENDETMYRSRVRGQGSISTVSFDDSKMYVADRTDRVTAYDLDSFNATETFTPNGTLMHNAWRYGIKPLYFAFPKPGEFYKVVSHLSSASDTSTNLDVDLAFQETPTNPWSPLTSGLTFMAVMLMLSCLVFSRTDY